MQRYASERGSRYGDCTGLGTQEVCGRHAILEFEEEEKKENLMAQIRAPPFFDNSVPIRMADANARLTPI